VGMFIWRRQVISRKLGNAEDEYGEKGRFRV
jgi:hypothetical protein